LNIIEIIGLITGLLGVISFILYILEKKPQKKFTWKKAEKYADQISNTMMIQNYRPTLVFGIGRGGAIFGSMISGCMGHLPLIVIDRKYTWSIKGRIDDLIFPVNIPKEYLQKVLLVAGETHSGSTMSCFYDYIKQIGAKEVRRAVLFYEEECPTKIEYYGIQSVHKKIRLPWMFSPKYVRADRGSVNNQDDDTSKFSIKLFLIRHAETNVGEDIFAGSKDYPLSVNGIRQALNLGHYFTSRKINTVFSSPQERAVKTAMIIHNFISHNTDFVIDNNLREIDFGEWEGRSRQEVKKQNAIFYENWSNDSVSNQPPNSENPKDVLKRILQFLNELESKFVTQEGIELVAVLHKTVIRILLAHLNGKILNEYRSRKIDNCQLIILQYSGKKWEEIDQYQ